MNAKLPSLVGHVMDWLQAEEEILREEKRRS
jgi:hypothetical protein